MLSQLNRFFLMVVFLTSSLHSSFVIAQSGQPAAFLRWGVGGRSLGMGRAATALVDGASALYWNPAGLTGLNKRHGYDLEVMLTELLEGTNYNFVGLAVPLEQLTRLKNFNVGLGFLYYSTDEILSFDEFGNPLNDSSNDFQSAVYLSFNYSWKLMDHVLGIGLNIKPIHHSLFGETANTTTFDIGFKFIPEFGWLNLALAFQNINEPELAFSKSSGSRDTVPRYGRVGVTIRPPADNDWLRRFLFSFDYEILKPTGAGADLFFGLEYGWIGTVVPMKLRLGMNSGEAGDSFSIGATVDLSQQNIHDFDQKKWLPRVHWVKAFDNQDGAGSLYSTLGESIGSFSFNLSFGAKTDKEIYEEGMQDFSEIYEGLKH